MLEPLGIGEASFPGILTEGSIVKGKLVIAALGLAISAVICVPTAHALMVPAKISSDVVLVRGGRAFGHIHGNRGRHLGWYIGRHRGWSHSRHRIH